MRVTVTCERHRFHPAHMCVCYSSESDDNRVLKTYYKSEISAEMKVQVLACLAAAALFIIILGNIH